MESIIDKALKKPPQDLPELLINGHFRKLRDANPQELKTFLCYFKKKFFQGEDKKYTKSLYSLFSTALLWHSSDHFNLLKNVFETGIDPNVQLFGKLGDPKAPLLHHALKNKFPPFTIVYFLKNGALCLSKNKAGDLPIHQFVKKVDDYNSRDAVEILHLLFRKGGFNSEGASALELAYERINTASLLAVKVEMFKLLNYQSKVESIRMPNSPFSIEMLSKRLLATDKPSGYNPLQTRPVFEQALIDEGKESGEITFFKDTDVEIVTDGNQERLLLKQATYSEAAACQALFERIKNGKTCIQWENDEVFNEKVPLCLKKLLTRPSGRELIYSLVKSNYPLFIIENRRVNGSLNPEEMAEKLPGLISVDLTQFRPMPCLNSNGDKVMQMGQGFLRLGHELLHARLRTLFCAEEVVNLLNLNSKNPDWDNLNEQFVIAGLEGEAVLCENMLRFEFGELARNGHVVWE